MSHKTRVGEFPSGSISYHFATSLGLLLAHTMLCQSSIFLHALPPWLPTQWIPSHSSDFKSNLRATLTREHLDFLGQPCPTVMCSHHHSPTSSWLSFKLFYLLPKQTLPKLLFSTSPWFFCCPVQWYRCHLTSYQHWQLPFFFNIPSWWCVKDITTTQIFVH